MNLCPNCGMGAHDREFCLECGMRVMPAPDEVQDLPDRGLRQLAVYKAPDEIAAVTMQKVLEAEGIRSWIQAIQEPWVDGIMKMVEGYWGKVIVFEDQEEAARRVIESYFKSLGPHLH